MTDLELRFLGDFQVLQGGAPQPLPPSRKTRALLAYLSLHPRPFRREHLCELLWEIPDDPRGSLRWSLSKLRRLVDSPDHKRIVADRTSVGLDARDLPIDAVDLYELAEKSLKAAPLEALEHAAAEYQGNFLEGLELSGFHDFHAWWVAERERTVRAQAAILSELVERLADDPERALPHARALVAVSPYDEAARARLIRLLVSLRHAEEAEEHYRMGRRMLKELGVESTGALFSAWRGAPGQPAAAKRPPASVTPPPPPQPSNAASLLGRESEQGRLTDLYSRVQREGTARFVLVRGEPGIGKSALLVAAAGQVNAARGFLLQAGAYRSETYRPFALWIDALRRLGPDADAAVFGEGDPDNRERLFANLAALVEREADSRPVVVIFDDFQWSDESSAAALHYVARMNRERPLLGILAARAGELRDNAAARQALRDLRHDGQLDEIRLGPLPDAAIRRLIAERVPEADPEALNSQTGGNPLLAIELARAGDAGGGSLDELVRERLARFDVEGADVLRWAAVLGPRIDLDTLVMLTGQDATGVGSALETAERLGLLASTDQGIRFAHEMLARGVYNEISPLRRQVMHRRVAGLLEENSALDLDYAAELAHHALHSGDAGLAARSLVLAGRLCRRFFANEEAVAHARSGLQLAEQLTGAERVKVSIELHEVMLSAAPLEDWESAAEEYVMLAEQALDHGALEHARLGYHLASTLRWEHGHWTGAREQSLQAARVIRGGSDQHNIIGLAETAKCLAMLERDLSQADAMLMEAEGLAQRLHFRHHSIPMGLGLLRLHEDRLEEAEELFLQARTLCKSEGDRISEFQANENLAMIAWYRGDFELARERCAQLMELGSKLREGSEEPLARALHGLCVYHEKDEHELLDAALEDLRVADAKHRLAYTQSRAAMVELERGRHETAQQRAAEALACAELLQRPTEMLLANTALYRACRALGDAAGAEAHREAMLDLTGRGAANWARQQAEKALKSEMEAGV